MQYYLPEDKSEHQVMKYMNGMQMHVANWKKPF